MTERVPSLTPEALDVLTAREWRRAAFVWAHVGPGKPYTVDEFAALRIHGLSKTFVRKYWNRWQSVINSGHAEPVVPGGKFHVPDVPWVPIGNPHMSGCSCGCWDREC